jgi:hypothetical protein
MLSPNGKFSFMPFDMRQTSEIEQANTSPPGEPTVRDVIEGARAYIANPKTWTRHTLARGRTGFPCLRPYSNRAVRFCANGALQRAAFELLGRSQTATCLARQASNALAGRTMLKEINDAYNGREAVLEIVDSWFANNPRRSDRDGAVRVLKGTPPS